jgi:hypothetical protein
MPTGMDDVGNPVTTSKHAHGQHGGQGSGREQLLHARAGSADNPPESGVGNLLMQA